MGTISGQDRRRVERSERDLALRLYANGRPIPDVQLRDVSSEGFGVQVAGELKAGDNVTFEFQLEGAVVSGRAAVVWAEPFHMGYRGGARFTRLSWFGRRRLEQAIAGKDARPGWGDSILILVAAVLFAAMAVDFLLGR